MMKIFLFVIEMFIRVDAVTQLPELEDPSRKDSKIDILWSLRPIIAFARCIGVEFQLDSYTAFDRNKFVKMLIVGYCFVCLLLDTISQMNLARFLYQSIIYKSSLSSDWNTFHPNWTAAASWNNIIDLTNYSIHNFGSHLIFIFIVRTKWTDVVGLIIRFEFEDSFIVKLRRMSVIGITYITVLVRRKSFKQLNFIRATVINGKQ